MRTWPLNREKKQLADPKLYPLSIPGYPVTRVGRFHRSSDCPVRPGAILYRIGNHELVPPKTRNEFVSRFTDWLVTPALQEQRLADDPTITLCTPIITGSGMASTLSTSTMRPYG